MKAFLILLILSLTANAARAQKLDWDMTGWQALETPLSKLPEKDRQGIARRLGEGSANLVAMRVNSASGSLFLVQGVYRVGGICGANNCAFWVLDSNYKILMEKVTQTFKLESSTHNRLPDIITSMHGSAFESSLSYWQFNGKRYVRVACADAVYGDADGNSFDKPHISPHPCGTGG